jgi:hypothetical protein
MLVAAYLVFSAFSPTDVDTDEPLAFITAAPMRFTAAALLIAFPPVITLSRGVFNVYEEAAVYGYYCAIALIASTIIFARRPTLAGYLALSLFAGLAAFVRPTIGAYGLATLVVTGLITRQARWSWSKSLAGPALFGIGCALLYWSNLVRFGSGVEFGHQLTCTSLDLMYRLRFRTAANDIDFWSAAKELLGYLFFAKRPDGSEFYLANLISWESPAPRWRNFYQTTFDWTYLAAILAIWFWVAWNRIAPQNQSRTCTNSELTVTAAWAVLSVAALTTFYLQYVAMSSRYLVDFAPAIGASIFGGISACEVALARRRPAASLTRICALAILLGWWAYELGAGENMTSPSPPLTRDEALAQMPDGFPKVRIMPESYAADRSPAEVTGIPNNGAGWTHPNGEASEIVVLYVEDPDELRLEVAPGEDANPTDEQYAAIRAKVGLEILTLNSVERTEHGRILTFSAPKREAYHHGIQVVYLAFLSPDEFLDGVSPFRMLRVEWHGQGTMKGKHT